MYTTTYVLKNQEQLSVPILMRCLLPISQDPRGWMVVQCAQGSPWLARYGRCRCKARGMGPTRGGPSPVGACPGFCEEPYIVLGINSL